MLKDILGMAEGEGREEGGSKTGLWLPADSELLPRPWLLYAA
jgi:hypothetical protein